MPTEYAVAFFFFSSKMVQSTIGMDQCMNLQIARPLTLLLLLQLEVQIESV